MQERIKQLEEELKSIVIELQETEKKRNDLNRRGIEIQGAIKELNILIKA